MAKYLALAWMMGTLGAGLARAQSTNLTFTGVWSTLPLTGLAAPSDVVGDTAGNLYFTDFGASSIIKLAADGTTQSTVGSGLNAPSGLAIDASGTLYVTSFVDSKVYTITPGGTQTAIGAGWSSPVSIAVDTNGLVWVTDNNGLSSITSGGTQTLVISGANVKGVAVDSSNNIYYGNNPGSEGIYEIPFGGSSGTFQFFVENAENIFIDGQGNIYVAETGTGVQRIDDAFGDNTTFGNASISDGVWGDTHQNLYIADASGSVEKLSLGAVDFGSVQVCPLDATVTPCTSTQVLNYAFDSDVYGTISTTRPLTQDTVNLDYQVAVNSDSCTSLGDGALCSLTISYAPYVPGESLGAVQLIGTGTVDLAARPVGPAPRVAHPRPRDDPSPGSELSTVLLNGIGIAPVGVFNTAPIATIPFTPLTDSYLSGVTFDRFSDLFITDTNNCVVQEDYDGTTTLIAGTTCGLDTGDGAAATSATLNNPWRTVLDGAGNLYISELSSHKVRRVDGYTGIITTYAGTGTSGYSGDGGAATSAELSMPTGLAVDVAGNLFIADAVNNVVRRVDVFTGMITTIVGNGTAGYSGDGGAASSAELNYPDALALDSAGNLYIADGSNHVIRKLAGGVITTIAGNGTAGHSGDGGQATSAELHDPEGVAVDAAGNVYIADAQNFLVRQVNVSTGIITTVAGAYTGTAAYTGDTGPATLAGLSYDEDVAVYPTGYILIADTGNHVVRFVQGPIGLDGFGSVALGASPAAQDVIFSNTGTSTLTVTGLQAPTNFTLGGADTTCTSSTTLAVSADCVLGIEFVPTADGSLTGNLVVSDNYVNEPTGWQQDVALAGTGTGLAPAKLAFAASLPSITAGGNLGTVVIDVESSTGALTGATSVVTLTITGPGGYSQTVMATAVNGVATFDLGSLTLSATGAYTATATSANLTQAQATTTVTGGSPAAPAELTLPSVPASIPAGASLGTVPVDIDNSSGTLLNNAINPVTLTITGPGGYSYSVTVAGVNGVSNFNLSSLSLTTPGTYTLTATSAGLTQAVATVTVTTATPSTATQLAVTPTPPAMIGFGGNLGTLTVDVENSSGALVSSATDSVTLTITRPGGYSYTTTVAAAGGVADFDLSPVAFTTPGTYTLTFTSGYLVAAVYTVTVTVDFTIAVTSGTPAASSPILPGARAAFSFTLAPASGSFPGAITLTATGMPAGATYSFSPATVTPGSSSAATAMTIQTLRYGSAALHEDHRWVSGWGAMALGLLLLPISGKRRMRSFFRRGPLLSLALLLLALGTAVGLSGCGAGGLFGLAQQSYTITVTGTSGSLSHSATVTLTVQ